MQQAVQSNQPQLNQKKALNSKSLTATQTFIDVTLLGCEAVLPGIAVSQTYKLIAKNTQSEGLRIAGAAGAGILSFAVLEGIRRKAVGSYDNKIKQVKYNEYLARMNYPMATAEGQMNGSYPQPGMMPPPAGIYMNPDVAYPMQYGYVNVVPEQPINPEDADLKKAVDGFNEDLKNGKLTDHEEETTAE